MPGQQSAIWTASDATKNDCSSELKRIGENAPRDARATCPFCTCYSNPVKHRPNTKPVVLVFTGRPGAGKTVLSVAWRKRHPEYAAFDVGSFIRRFAGLQTGAVDEKKTIIGYRRFYQFLRRHIRRNTIIEIGTNHPDVNLKELGRLRRYSHLWLIFLLRSTAACLRNKQRQRGAPFSPSQLRRRMKRTFPSIHRRFARRNGVPTYTLFMHRGNEHALKALEHIVARVRQP